MARYVWIVRAFSPRDGGWVRVFGSFRSEQLAWNAIEFFWEMIVESGDYESLEVKRTISFRELESIGQQLARRRQAFRVT